MGGECKEEVVLVLELVGLVQVLSKQSKIPDNAAKVRQSTCTTVMFGWMALMVGFEERRLMLSNTPVVTIAESMEAVAATKR